MTPEEFVAKVTRSPLWMEDLACWHWKVPGGVQQNLAGVGVDLPGLANLLWLTLPSAPPKYYDARSNPHFMWVAANAMRTTLGGVLLSELAAQLTLEQFAQLQTDHGVIKYLINKAKERANAVTG